MRSRGWVTRWGLLAPVLVAGGAAGQGPVPPAGPGQPGGPTPVYQRSALRPGPALGGPRFRGPIFGPNATIESGAFQRPYPYHLDYYKQRFGGGYEPYFGNLYGPPAVVGAQPFAASQYPQSQPAAGRRPQKPAPQARAPAAVPTIVCPHCGEAVQLLWQAPPTK